MNTMNLIRAWKDAEFRATLSAEELAALPQHPAGLVELPEEEFLHRHLRSGLPDSHPAVWL